jgi:hypothetical protein
MPLQNYLTSRCALKLSSSSSEVSDSYNVRTHRFSISAESWKSWRFESELLLVLKQRCSGFRAFIYGPTSFSLTRNFHFEIYTHVGSLWISSRLKPLMTSPAKAAGGVPYGQAEHPTDKLICVESSSERFCKRWGRSKQGLL